MAIITKPAGGILKGVPASISLSKSELSALSIIVADSYFSNTSNWNKVILKYRSSTGKQYEAVQFDATLSSPTGNFLVSIKARDAFEIQTIEIHDFDNDIFIVPRSALNVADFDVVLSLAPSSLSYSTPVTYTQNTAITNNVPTVTGTVTSYSILPALPAGLSLNTTTGVISGTPTEVSAAANYVVTASNEAGSTTATINITVVESMEEFDIVNFTGRNNPTYISFPAPGSVTRLLPAVNLENNGQGSFWSTTPLSGDFTFTATVKAGSVSDGPVQALFGLNDVMPPPSNSGYGLKAAGWGLNFYNDGSVVRPWDVGVDTLAYTKGSTYNIEIKRVSGVVSYKVNSTTFPYTLSTSATVYLVGYLQVGSWEVTNAQLAAEEFTGGPIPWNNTSSGYLIELDGGVTTTAQRPSGPIFDIVYGSSNSYVTGDFIYEAEISTSLQSDSIVGFYDSVGGPYNTIVKGGATTLSFWLTNEWNNGTPEYTMAKPSGDTFLFKITRVGTLVKLFVNNVEIASETTTVSHLLVPFFTLRPNDYIVDAQITFEEVPVGDPIIWDTFLNGSTPQADGGISGGTSGAIVKSNASKAENGADFKFTFNFTRGPANDSYDYLWGIMPSTANTGFTGWTGVTLQSSNSILIYDNYSGSGAHTASFTNGMIVDGPNTSEFEKIGNVLTIKMNSVTIYTKNNYTEQTSVPMVRLWQGEQVLDSAYAEIQEATINYLTYELNPAGATLNATGGVSGGNAGDDLFAKDSSGASGDFAYEWKFNWSSINPFNVLFGVTSDYNAISYANLTCLEGVNSTNPEKARLWVNGTQNVLTNITIPDGDNVYKLTRVGTTISHYLNGSLIYSSSVPLFTAYPTVRTKGLSACIESYIPQTPELSYYLYNQLGTGHTTDAFGGITSSTTNGLGSLSFNTNAILGDFDIQFTFNSAMLIEQAIFGIKSSLDNNDNWAGFIYRQGGTATYFSGNTQDVITQNSGSNVFRLKRTSGLIEFYANGIKLPQSISYAQPVYLTVRANTGFNLISTVDKLEAPAFTAVPWVIPQAGVYNTLPNGGIEIGPQRGSFFFPFPPYYLIYATSQYHFSSDFNVEYEFTSGNGIDYNAGMDIPNSYGSFTGLSVGNDNINTVFFAGSPVKQLSGGLLAVKIRVQRIGNTASVYINDVLEHSGNLTITLSPSCSISAGDTRKLLSAKILAVPPVVTWNVAGKTGVGTVTTGANGLITKATGGSGYNVNVLSNETITGDGYVEFVSSSLFFNVVFGLAEINSSSGYYDQIIYGTYVATSVYEKVLAGSAMGGNMAAYTSGDVIRIQRTGTTFNILKNGSVIDTVTINNTNPLKASISIYSENYGVNNVTISE